MRIVDIVTSVHLLEQLSDGQNTDASIAFMDCYRMPLLEFAQARGFSNIDLEFVVQETLRATLLSIQNNSYDRSTGRLRDWMLAILNNQLKNELRALTRRKHREELYTKLMPPDLQEGDHASISDEALWRHVILRQAIRTALRQPAVQGRTREVFISLVLRGEPVAEIAQRWQIKPNAIYQIRSRMFAKIRKIARAIIHAKY